jgi:hypothetical protein
MERDNMEIMNHKKKMIDEIKALEKNLLFKETKKKKLSFLDKLKKILGYGKKD